MKRMTGGALCSAARGILIAAAVWITSNVQAQLTPGNSIFLNEWTFEDGTNWLATDGNGPISLGGIECVNDGAGHSLLVDGTEPAWLNFAITETFNGGSLTNLSLQKGTIMFWFMPLWSGANAGGDGPGVPARLIDVGEESPDASIGYWGLYFDPAGTNIYFSAQSNGVSITYLSAPISWTNGGWHALALRYSPTNSSLMIDGSLVVSNGLPVTVWPSDENQADGFFIGSDRYGSNTMHGLMDNLSTYASIEGTAMLGSLAAIYSIIYDTPNPHTESAPFTPSYDPTFNVITGNGFLQAVGSLDDCTTNANIWLTNIVAAPNSSGGMNFTFAAQGGYEGEVYDVFASSILDFSANTVWGWMGQTPRCQVSTLTNLPSSQAFLLISRVIDSDHDGLSDSFEKLVSKTDPYSADSDGDGMLDGWEVMWGYNPLSNDFGQTGQRSNYVYDLAGWLNTIFGVRAETVSLDSEGNVQLSQ